MIYVMKKHILSNIANNHRFKPTTVLESPWKNTLQLTPGVFFLLALLYVGQKLLIPLSFALLISLILFPITRWLEDHGWPRILAIFSSLSILMVLFSGLIILLIQQVGQFLKRWPKMQAKLDSAVGEISYNAGTLLGFTDLEKQEWINSLIGNFTEYLVELAASKPLSNASSTWYLYC